MGKYQYCTQGPDGKMYADADFANGDGGGKLRAGAIPAPDERNRRPYRWWRRWLGL